MSKGLFLLTIISHAHKSYVYYYVVSDIQMHPMQSEVHSVILEHDIS